MFFITKRKYNRLLKEERERSLKLGYKLCQIDYGAKGFITGKDDLFQEIKEHLKKGV